MVEYVLVLVESNSDILLILKDRPKWMAGRLNLPGGKVEEVDKSISSDPKLYSLEAASRELKEETGYVAHSLKYSGSIIGNNCVIYVVKADVYLTNVIERNSDETESVEWYNWQIIKNDLRLMPNLRVIIPLSIFDLNDWIIQDFSNDINNEIQKLIINFRTN